MAFVKITDQIKVDHIYHLIRMDIEGGGYAAGNEIMTKTLIEQREGRGNYAEAVSALYLILSSGGSGFGISPAESDLTGLANPTITLSVNFNTKKHEMAAAYSLTEYSLVAADGEVLNTVTSDSKSGTVTDNNVTFDLTGNSAFAFYPHPGATIRIDTMTADGSPVSFDDGSQIIASADVAYLGGSLNGVSYSDGGGGILTMTAASGADSFSAGEDGIKNGSNIGIVYSADGGTTRAFAASTETVDNTNTSSTDFTFATGSGTIEVYYVVFIDASDQANSYYYSPYSETSVSSP